MKEFKNARACSCVARDAPPNFRAVSRKLLKANVLAHLFNFIEKTFGCVSIGLADVFGCFSHNLSKLFGAILVLHAFPW